MKIRMPEPKVANDGTVTLPHANPVVGSVGKNKRGWWACVETTRRKLGMPWMAGGMRSRHNAVRWLLAHALDWRTYP